MQFTYAAISALLASVAYSQTIASEVAQIPSCALTCLSTAISGAGCSLTDYACQCGSAKDAITKSATPCIAAACSASDTLTVAKVTTEICVLQAASGSSSSGSASAASTASSASSAASSSASSAVSNMSSATGSSIASASRTATSVASSASGAASSALSSVSSAASAAVATATTAGGNRVNAAGAVIGAGLLAALAL